MGDEHYDQSYVDDYDAVRAPYPGELVALLEAAIGFSTRRKIADLGAGTGLLTRLFVDYGNEVLAVEPSARMRAALAQRFSGEPRLAVIAGSAESTTLPDATVDLVTAGQAAHQFDWSRCRPELHRIMAPDAYVLLVWNYLDPNAPLSLDLATAANAAPTQAAVVPRRAERLQAFAQDILAPDLHSWRLDNPVWADRDALTKYVLLGALEADSDRAEVEAAVDRAFERHKQGARVRLPYETHAFVGRLQGEIP